MINRSYEGKKSKCFLFFLFKQKINAMARQFRILRSNALHHHIKEFKSAFKILNQRYGRRRGNHFPSTFLGFWLKLLVTKADDERKRNTISALQTSEVLEASVRTHDQSRKAVHVFGVHCYVRASSTSGCVFVYRAR